jgi:hypothetical protein
MSKLLNFLNSLDSDAALLSAFQKDPAAAMARAGLSAAEQQAIISGDKSALSKLAGIDEAECKVAIYISPPSTSSTPTK